VSCCGQTNLFDPHMFRMRWHLFVHIINAIEEHNDYFVQKMNAAGTFRLSYLQKVATAFNMIAYGVPADATDDYVRMGASATDDYMCVGESTAL
jgi:hypothetical protein